MTAALVGAVAIGFTTAPWRRVVAIVTATAAVVAVPALLIPGSLAWGLAVAVNHFRSARRRNVEAATDLASLCDLFAIALTGGLGLGPALELAARHVGGSLEREIAAVLRNARVDGLAWAAAAADGTAAPLYRIIAQSATTGAALTDPIAGLADELNAEAGARQLEQVRRLPVAMLFPLTALILPGFLLLAIAPAILDAFSRLAL